MPRIQYALFLYLVGQILSTNSCICNLLLLEFRRWIILTTIEASQSALLDGGHLRVTWRVLLAKTCVPGSDLHLSDGQAIMDVLASTTFRVL